MELIIPVTAPPMNTTKNNTGLTSNLVDMIYQATNSQYTVINKTVAELSIRDKRQIFQNMRKAEDRQPDKKLDNGLFLIHHGITVGQFALFQILHDHIENKTRQE